jgi:SAM-dependent methyltransferase
MLSRFSGLCEGDLPLDTGGSHQRRPLARLQMRQNPLISEHLSIAMPAYEPSIDIVTSSDAYARRFRGKTGSWFLKTQRDATLRLLSQIGGVTVLDVGGGHGQLTPGLIQADYDVTVLASHPVCRKRIASFIEEGACKFITGSFYQLPFMDRSFDMVLAYHQIQHLPLWKRAASELIRVSKKAVVIDFPSKKSINGFASSLFWLKKILEGEHTRTFTSFSESTIVSFFHEKGFVMQGRFSKFFIPMVIHRVLRTPELSDCLEKLFRIAGITERYGSPVIASFIPARPGGESA